MAEETKVDDFLAHYGVAGMKWGQRRAQNASLKDAGASRKEARAEKKEARKARDKETIDARARVASREAKLNAALIDQSYAQSPKVKAQANKLVEKHSSKLLTSGDRELAARTTTGEKWMAAGAVAAFGAITVGQIALSVASSRR